MFSLSKLLLLALVIFAVWYGYRIWTKMARARDQVEGKQTHKPRQVEAEDMVACPACGVFVPSGAARKCGKPGCPQG